ncbi:hypothetical protein GCM10011611_54780 [Aliidongia dinghuensis]|uniref:Uncharacterized protein n=1 Tax=Aliidongia dinghuensis TaxID=1867774 RepID=A0A8J2YZ37_9PROT|nr:hypothetical protein [Aliidongia dinghuensis]GGF41390.1 hypothetical protein GCM10011611_54780 [Aliidongia dinghuensis]
MNAATAIGTLLIGVVSLWATTQISGLEDYFRSEIVRRNNELSDIAEQSRRLKSLADDREKRLADLQNITEQITVANLSTQSKLLSTQKELAQLEYEILNAKEKIASSEERLTSLAAQSREQISLIDSFRRQRFYSILSRRIVFDSITSEVNNTGIDGEGVYKTLTTMPPSDMDPELASYLPEFRANAQSTCQWIRTYRRTPPQKQTYPDAPKMPGEKVENGNSKMSQQEYNDWTAARDEWNKRYDAIVKSNTDANNTFQKDREYLMEAALNCACRALATAAHPVSAICPADEKQPKPPSP